MNHHPVEGRAKQAALLHAAGWPQDIGLNDKRTTSHNHLSLDGQRVDTFWTKGHGFFVLDSKIGLVVRDADRDTALLKMAAGRRAFYMGEGRNEQDHTVGRTGREVSA